MSRVQDIQIEDHSGEAIDELRQKIPQILTEIGLHLEGEAKQALEDNPRRVDTGLLRNSITFALSGEGANISSYQSDPRHDGTQRPVSPTISGSYSGTTPAEDARHMAVYIGTNVEYSTYVHEGYHSPSGDLIPANRFIKNAVELNKDQIRKKIKEKLST